MGKIIYNKLFDITNWRNPNALYEFSTFTFTNAGATGKLGPTLEQCKTAYAGEIWIDNLDWFNVQGPANGIQKWTVPKTGNYIIEVAGSRASTAYAGYGDGAKLKGKINLIKGEVLLIAIGQPGFFYAGGGGTFVAKGSLYSEATPLIVAGGGGGGYTNGSTEKNGRTTIKGGICSAVPANLPGDNGNAGGDSRSGSDSYDPGAGWLNGARQYNGSINFGFLQGAQGSNSETCGANPSGFGGGSGSCPGGGGGYSGGAAGGNQYGGGGGGSFFDAAFTDRSTSDGAYENSTTGIISTLGYNANVGYCIITQVV